LRDDALLRDGDRRDRERRKKSGDAAKRGRFP